MSIESISNSHRQPEVDKKDSTSCESEVSVLPQSASLDGGIRIVKSGNCPSLSGQSTLTYQFGIKDESSLHMRLISNTGGGLFSNDWISCDLLDEFLVNKSELTSGSFKALFPNKSVNTGGFVMAVLKALGLIQVSELNSRWHEHVPEMTFECVRLNLQEQKDESIKERNTRVKRKAKEV